jgi:Reverse transcriptase (RNA-dependent DNA polymerase)
MNIDDYDNGVFELLQNGPYKRITRNPLNNTVEKTRKVIKTVVEQFDLPDYMKYRLKVSNPVIPAMYALPKIHKEGNKMRPIVSSIGSPTEPLARWLVEELRTIEPPPGLDIKNSIEFTESLKEFEIEEDELLVSFDVTSLYPSIPIDIAVKNMEEWLVTKRVDIHKIKCYMDVVNLCMDENYFKFRDNIYKQTEGTSMGNPLSPILANIYMKKFETDLSKDKRFPRCWLRYVDDIFVILKEAEIDNTLDWINDQHGNIQFTIEKESNNQLPFLDVLVKRNEKQINFSIYRKPTNTEKYIAADSFHPTQHKHAAFHSMAFRMCNISMSAEDYNIEKRKIIEIGRQNGYNNKDITSIIHKHELHTKRKQQTTFYGLSDHEKRTNKRISIPHWPKITNHMKKTFKEQKLEIVTTSSEFKIKNKLGTTKDKKDPTEKSGVYQINCATRGCKALYIGQTRRAISSRFKEHENATKNEQLDKSSVAKHMIMKDDSKKRSYKHKFTKDNLSVVKYHVNRASDMITQR